MKIRTLFTLALLSASAHATISINGTGLTAVKGVDGVTNIPTGTIGLLIVDTAGDGFFNLGNPLNNTALTSTSDPLLTPSVANLTINSTFGGEKILNVLSSPGGGTFSGLATSLSIAGMEGKNFAIVWLNILAAGAPATAPNGTQWGIIRGSDWVLPATDSGGYPINAGDTGGVASYYAPNTQTGGAATTAFRTTVGGNGGEAFIVGVPEPSAALLGALGVLGLLRRRRI